MSQENVEMFGGPCRGHAGPETQGTACVAGWRTSQGVTARSGIRPVSNLGLLSIERSRTVAVFTALGGRFPARPHGRPAARRRAGVHRDDPPDANGGRMSQPRTGPVHRRRPVPDSSRTTGRRAPAWSTSTAACAATTTHRPRSRTNAARERGSRSSTRTAPTGSGRGLGDERR